MPKTVGVLGGMGPLAAAVFTQYLVDLTPADRDQEHIPVILINDPTIPERTSYILGTSAESPVPKLVARVRMLEQMGAGLISVPCNTVHAFWSEIARSVSIPVLHIIDETARRIERECPGGTVGLLATKGSVKAGLYQEALGPETCRLILPSADLQNRIQTLIEQVKAGQDRDALGRVLQGAIDEMRGAGADRVIMGCTELSLLGPAAETSQALDSMRILAEATVEQAFLCARQAATG